MLNTAVAWGPDVKRGYVTEIAATIAALLGQNYRTAFPHAGAPMADMLGGTIPPPPPD